MKRLLILGGCLSASLASADTVPPVVSTATPSVVVSTVTSTPPVVVVSTPAVVVSTPTTPPVSVPAVPVVASPAAPASAAALPGMVRRDTTVEMNEMTGTVESIDTDEHDLRITAKGGFNIDFKYTRGSSFTDHDTAITAEDLVYGDTVLIRYVGRDLQARQVLRLDKAPGSPPAP